MSDSVGIYNAQTNKVTSVKSHMSRLKKKSCRHVKLNTNKQCGEPAMHLSVYSTGIFPRCTNHGRIGTGDGDEYVRATINEHGLQVLPKKNIDDILYYKCNGCGADTVAGDLRSPRSGKVKHRKVCSKCAKGESGRC